MSSTACTGSYSALFKDPSSMESEALLVVLSYFSSSKFHSFSQSSKNHAQVLHLIAGFYFSVSFFSALVVKYSDKPHIWKKSSFLVMVGRGLSRKLRDDLAKRLEKSVPLTLSSKTSSKPPKTASPTGGQFFKYLSPLENFSFKTRRRYEVTQYVSR